LPSRVEAAMVVTRQKHKIGVAWRNRKRSMWTPKAWELYVLITIAFAITPALQRHPACVCAFQSRLSCRLS
jgi:hypothetical protein